jgi:1,4-alpha-glucan branching enzyme
VGLGRSRILRRPLDGEVEAVLGQVRGLTVLPALQRIHADLHLGQVLRAPDGSWLVLDFEGEPLRPTAERSVPDVPVRDVVGMVRSLEYAAASRGAFPEGSDEARASEQWAASATSAFLAGYADEAGAAVDEASPLFRALWLDKALYEVVYELRNRPEWVEMPARDVRRALSSASAGEQVAVMASAGAASGAADAAGAGAPGTAQSASGPVAAGPGAARGPAAGPASAGSPAAGSPSDPQAHRGARDLLQQVSDGVHHQPHAVLGAHLDDSGVVTIRTLRRLAALSPS